MKIFYGSKSFIYLLAAFIGSAAYASDLADARLGEHETFTRAVIIVDEPLVVHCDVSADGRTAILHFNRALSIRRGKMIRTKAAAFDTISETPQDNLEIHFKTPMKLAYQNVYPVPAGSEYRLALDFSPLDPGPDQSLAAPPPAEPPSAIPSPAPRSTGLEAALGVPLPPFGAKRNDILSEIGRKFGSEKTVVEMSGKSSTESPNWIIMLDVESPVLGPVEVMYFLTSAKEGLYKVDTTLGKQGTNQYRITEALDRRLALERQLADAGLYAVSSSAKGTAKQSEALQYIDARQRIASAVISPLANVGADDGGAIYSVHLIVTGPITSVVNTGTK
jgi:hypothetical protein